MDTLGNETASKQDVKNPLIISHGQTLSMTNVTPQLTQVTCGAFYH